MKFGSGEPGFAAVGRRSRGRSGEDAVRYEHGVAMWKKVIAPTALVSLFWILVSCGTAYVLNRLDETQTDLLNENRNVILAAGGMQENLWRLQATLLESAKFLQKEPSEREKVRARAEEFRAGFKAALDRAQKNASTPDEQTLTAQIGERFTDYREFSLRQLARDDLSAGEAASVVEAGMRLAQSVAQPCAKLSDFAQRLTGDAFQRRDRLRRRVNAARIGFIIIGPAVGILLGLWVARGLHHTISEISVTLRGASGEMEQEIGSVEVYPSHELDGLPALQQHVQAVSGRIRQVVDELQRTRREAVRAERLAAVGELAAGIAHEIRNPLTSVKLLIQAVQRSQPAESSDQKRLQVVAQEVARMESTIQELLDFARPPKLHRIRHDARDTLRRALTLVASRAEQNHVVIEEQFGSGPAMIDADPDQLDQVFVNLLLNAVESMSGGGNLIVTIDRQADPTDGLLRIVFRDTGAGIPEQVMSRLFEPFVTSKEHGTGMGLAISKRIMQEHGGRLSGSNAPPGGALFVVEVPLANDNPTPDSQLNGSHSVAVAAAEVTC